MAGVSLGKESGPEEAGAWARDCATTSQATKSDLISRTAGRRSLRFMGILLFELFRFIY
jgi:hypothetical protein